MNRERLQRIRNFQSDDWYPALVMRPLTILVMLLIADWKFLTPNRLTTLANIFKLAAAWLILDPGRWIEAVILLHLGILFDHLDGTVARYRRTFTKLGSFYDKVSDMVTWWPIMLAAGWQAYRQTGDAWYLILSTSSATAMNVRAYMKWLAQAETERVRWFEAREDPAAAVAKRTQPIVIKPPPLRTRSEWVRWFFVRWSRIVWFEEMDLWFWLSLALLIDRLEWGLWLLCVTQVIGCFAMIIVRHIEMTKVDARLRELEVAELAGPAPTPPASSS
ncbi:MAG: CDP-alcohol phosphatidyltransferase family protein [Deltaproteobacteria bacterium]|nr:CDP-alcohol phosphatidyltransferase family protein [Deltaproteobacteria bacterium]MDQ3300169.1 CDP-alcohol phosphatidyltransferase family protein [Myxococcota bacterium]